MKLSQYPVLHSRSKQIMVGCHLIRGLISNRDAIQNDAALSDLGPVYLPFLRG